MATSFLSIGLIVFSTLISSFASFFLKIASRTFKINILHIATNFHLILAVFLHATSAVIAIIAYRSGELTVLVPFGSLNYIWASILAIKFLGERMNRWKWIGVTSIIIGITFIGLGGI